jgi:hypothetical protein
MVKCNKKTLYFDLAQFVQVIPKMQIHATPLFQIFHLDIELLMRNVVLSV